MKTKHDRIAHWSFIVVIGISFIALAGWIVHVLSLASISQNYIPMAPATAISFIIVGSTALYIHAKQKIELFLQIILILLFVFNGIALFDSLSGYPIKIENFFSSSNITFRNFPIGRMSPFTITLFLLSIVSLFMIANRNRSIIKLSILFCTFGLFVSFIFDLGYLYGNPILYDRGIIPPALNTSGSFTILFAGMLFGFGMQEVPMKQFTGESVRARLMRNFLPFTLFIIVIAGWIDTIFFQFYDNHVLISAVVTVFSILVLTILISSLSKGIGTDIDNAFTMLQKAEEALSESEFHFQTLADSGQALIWTSGLNRECNYFNRPWLNFTGKDLNHELGNGWIEGIHPDDRENRIKTYNLAFGLKEKFSIDYRLQYCDGSYRWIQDNGTPRFNIDGEFIGYIGHCLDITERKQILESLIKSEERYRLISSVSTDYTFSTKVMPDGTLNLDWVAGAFESISGYSVEDFKSRGAWRNSIYPDDLHIDDNDILRLRSNQKTNSQIRTINDKGEFVWVQVFAHPVWDEKNNCLSGIYGAVTNITQQKLAEEELQNLNNKLEKRVVERTHELEERNDDLAKMNKLFVGREIRMLELKEKIRELEIKLEALTNSHTKY